jgi:hypothetical protein
MWHPDDHRDPGHDSLTVGWASPAAEGVPTIGDSPATCPTACPAIVLTTAEALAKAEGAESRDQNYDPSGVQTFKNFRIFPDIFS